MSQQLAYAVDVGTTKVVALAGRVDVRTGEAEILSVGEASSRGMKRGVVVDRDLAAESIAAAIDACGVRRGSAIVGIAGGHISSFNTEVTLVNRSRDMKVSEKFVEQLMDEAKRIELYEDERLIHAIPRDFILDGSEGVTQPVGLSARRVTMRAHVVTGAVSSIQNLLYAVEDCGVNVDEVVLEPLAAAESSLSREERETGVALLDIGGGTTDIAAFVDGALTHTDVIPLGGESFTADAAYGLKIPFEGAEKLKRRYGTVLPRIVDSVAPMRLGNRHYNAHFMSQILEYRAREVMEFARDSLLGARVMDRLPNGLALTGGGSLLDGMVDLAEEVIGLNARSVAPTSVMGESKAVQKPQYSTGVGLVHFAGRNNNRIAQRKGASKSSFGSIVAAISNWFRGG